RRLRAPRRGALLRCGGRAARGAGPERDPEPLPPLPRALHRCRERGGARLISRRATALVPATLGRMNVSALSDQLKKAVESGDGDAAWAALTPHEAELGRDLELTRMWLDLLRLTPQRQSLEAEVDL